VSPADRKAAWSRAALSPPRAHGAPLSAARLRTHPEDFWVEEQLSFQPSDAGPHWLLRVEKRSANTRWVALEIARLARVQAHDVGYAGLKDRDAVAVQWFSVPALGSSADFWREVATQEFKVLEVRANSRKLKRGALTGNRFRIRLRDVSWARHELDLKVAELRARGVPNYFGPQRFGRNGQNLDRAATWIDRQQAPRGRTERGFALSAARSMLFNASLARRVEAGDWAQLLPGDVASLDGSASHFAVTEVDGTLLQRAAAFDIHPTGPLWGTGELSTRGAVREREMAVVGGFSEVARLLESEGLTQERRPLRCVLGDFDVEFDAAAATVTVGFVLGRGQFATAVLREICDIGSASLEADEE
jgi:tRNA pseudouridine13 synthase